MQVRVVPHVFQSAPADSLLPPAVSTEDIAAAAGLIDPLYTRLTLPQLRDRLGQPTCHRLLQVTGLTSHQNRLHKLTLVALFARLGTRLFAEAYKRPCLAWPLSQGFANSGLDAMWDDIAAHFDQAMRHRWLHGQLSPSDVLDWYAGVVANTAHSQTRGLMAQGSAHEPAAALLSAAGAHALARCYHERHPDVLVVGAGAAGLAAASALMDGGLQVTVCEAYSQPGGRTRTDVSHFSTRVDLGAEHLHSGATSPLRDLCEQLGFTLMRGGAEPGLAFTGAPGEDPVANAATLAVARQRLIAMLNRIPANLDVAASTHIDSPDTQDIWQKTAEAQLGPLEMGVDMSELSSQDWLRIMPERDGDLYVAEGIGCVMHTLSLGLKVHYNSRVERIDWGNPVKPTVWVNGEAYYPKKILLTLSTGDLAHGGLQFEPPLPAWKSAAIAALPMGHYEKIVLQFDCDIFSDIAPGTYAQVLCEPNKPIDYFIKPPMLAQRPGAIVVAYVGGQFAVELSRGEEHMAVAYAVARLRLGFGADVDRHFVAGAMTHWERDNHGAYSAARPGHYGARAELRRPLHNVLFFAGEACDEELPDGRSWCTQVPGALRSGRAAAARIMALQEMREPAKITR